MRLRTRIIDPRRLVRARRCGIVRRNSTVCPFFWSGKVSSARPSKRKAEALSSHFWPLAGDGTSSPSTLTEDPVSASFRCSAPGAPASTTTWRFLKHEPSLSSTNEKSLASRRVRTQPETVTPWSGCSAASACLTLIRMGQFAPPCPPKQARHRLKGEFARFLGSGWTTLSPLPRSFFFTHERTRTASPTHQGRRRHRRLRRHEGLQALGRHDQPEPHPQGRPDA